MKGQLYARPRKPRRRPYPGTPSPVRGRRVTQKQPSEHGAHIPIHLDHRGQQVRPGSRADNRPNRARNELGASR